MKHWFEYQNAILWVPWAIVGTEAAVAVGLVLLALRRLRHA